MRRSATPPRPPPGRACAARARRRCRRRSRRAVRACLGQSRSRSPTDPIDSRRLAWRALVPRECRTPPAGDACDVSAHKTQALTRMAHGSADAGVLTPQSTFYEQGRFGRLFPTLPPFSADTPTVRRALMELGRPGGIMDAQDGTDPVGLIVDPAQSAHNPNNPDLTAGMTFLGQFLDHDMTFDPTSSLARRQDPESIRNFRIPALDLDSVYGGGPGVSPALYDQSIDGGRTTFLVETIPGSDAVSLGGTRTDLPRNAQNVALTGDPRNDE